MRKWLLSTTEMIFPGIAKYCQANPQAVLEGVPLSNNEKKMAMMSDSESSTLFEASGVPLADITAFGIFHWKTPEWVQFQLVHGEAKVSENDLRKVLDYKDPVFLGRSARTSCIL